MATPEPGLPHRDADGWVAAFAPEEEAFGDHRYDLGNGQRQNPRFSNAMGDEHR